MKGVVFNQFTQMVDETWGAEMTETIIDKANLPSGGAYTGVGTYKFQEMISLVQALSQESGLGPDELQKKFGEYLFSKLSSKYAMFLEGCTEIFAFLETIENTIHVEVKKLYPEAELPTFHYEKPEAHILEVTYRSQRPFADLAEGLLKGAINHFDTDVKIERRDLPVESGSKAIFRLIKMDTHND